MGVIRGTYLALEHMSKLSGGRGGVIVNTASMAGKAHNVLHNVFVCPTKESSILCASEKIKIKIVQRVDSFFTMGKVFMMTLFVRLYRQL